jgi:carbonic anhydrase
MKSYEQLFENNAEWVRKKLQNNEHFFEELAQGQTPEYLYIGCSDSRVTAEDMVGLGPGDVFVHRNIANLVHGVDASSMAVIEYAVMYLEVKHVIVCGHYNCGGVKAAMTPKDMGLLNPWLRGVRDVYRIHRKELDALTDETRRYERLVELNVQEQCINVMKSSAIQLKYMEKGFPSVHGWVFDIKTGKIIDLRIDFRQMLSGLIEIFNLTGAPIPIDTEGSNKSKI